MINLHWRDWIAQTFANPRGIAVELMALDLRREHLWMGLVALVCVSTILAALPAAIAPVPTRPLSDIEIIARQLLARPYIMAFISFSGIVVTVFGLHWTGKALGGIGRLDDMLILMVWLQFIRLLVQVVLLVVTLILPGLSGIAFLLTMSLMIWVFLNFVDCAHGFNSLLKVVGVTIVWIVGLTLGLSMVLALLGVGSAGVNGYV